MGTAEAESWAKAEDIAAAAAASAAAARVTATVPLAEPVDPAADPVTAARVTAVVPVVDLLPVADPVVAARVTAVVPVNRVAAIAATTYDRSVVVLVCDIVTDPADTPALYELARRRVAGASNSWV
jgi:hypothetical protein